MTLADDLRAVVTTSRVLDSPAELRTYAYDASFLTQLAPRSPDAVVIAASTEDVSAVMRYAALSLHRPKGGKAISPIPRPVMRLSKRRIPKWMTICSPTVSPR